MAIFLRSFVVLSTLAPCLLAQETTEPKPAGPLWKELITDPNRIKFYGFIRLDAQYDDSRPNNPQTIGWILSEDPAAPALGGSPVGAGDEDVENFNMHPRLTRFGADVDAGTVESLSNAKLTGKIEVDFFNNGLTGQSESRAALRMRHAWLKLGWKEISLLAGQTNDVISPLFPVVNSDLVMWGAGNLGDRRPQVRTEWNHMFGSTSLIVQAAAGLTGADDNQNLDNAGANAGNTFRDGDASGLPTVQARVAAAFPIGGQKAEFGIWAHEAWETTDAPIGTSGETDFDSTALGLDVSVPLFRDVLALKGEAWVGQNLDDVRGGIFQGVNTTTGEEIDSAGGFVELAVKTTARNTLYAGYSRDDPESSDLNAGGRTDNEIWYVASRWNYKPITIGLEYLHWTTRYVGFDDGTDNRIVAFIAYNI